MIFTNYFLKVLQGGGVGLIFYTDSAQAGPPTIAFDKMFYTSAELSTSTVFASSNAYIEHLPVFSTKRGLHSLL